jgi:nuclear GTP-binding protein
MAQRANDPRSVLIKAKKLPMSLLVDPERQNRVKILQIEKYEDTFGPNMRRKRVKLNNCSLEEMAETVEEKAVEYTTDKDTNINKHDVRKH